MVALGQSLWGGVLSIVPEAHDLRTKVTWVLWARLLLALQGNCPEKGRGLHEGQLREQVAFPWL